MLGHLADSIVSLRAPGLNPGDTVIQELVLQSESDF